MIASRGIHCPQPSEDTRSRFSVDCAGAQVCVHAQRHATVLDVDGEIDAANADLVGQTMCRFAQLNAPLIADLSQLSFLGIAGFRALIAFNQEIQQTGLRCQIVAGAALRRLTHVVTNHDLPVVDSVSDALACIDATTQLRRSARQSEPKRNTLE